VLHRAFTEEKQAEVIDFQQQHRQVASARRHNSVEKVKSSAESCSYDRHGETAQQMKQDRSKTVRKKAVRCADCKKKFDGWRKLQQHKRKSCLKSSLRFLCRECKAFFPSKTELNSHISAAHVAYSCKNICRSKNTNNSEKKSKGNSTSCSDKSTADPMKDFKRAQSLKWKKVLKKHPMNADDLKKWKSVLAYKVVKRGKVRKEVTNVGNKESDEAFVKRCTVGSNPFSFTTACAPDAKSFQFLCQSCLTVRFATYAELRQHEDWCARVRSSHGFLCVPCGRHYRNLGTLRRHADEYHKMPISSEVKKTVGNPFLFSTTVAIDAASHPHVCSSCQLVCFKSSTVLRRHEDWCGQCISAKDGFKCDRCGRYFRTDALLERHTAADDCLKTENVAETVDDLKVNGGTESESSDSDAKQKPAPEATIHSVCPLCDVPFISQYEQQVHFMNVHRLTLAELKIKHPFQRQSRRGFIGTQVTCLDCDLVFSSRLKLVQHKRMCMKGKKFTEVSLPVTPSILSTVEDGNSTRKEDSLKAGLVAMSKSTSGKSTDTLTKSYSSRSEDTAGKQRSEISKGLLLNTDKVRDLIRHTGAKQLLLKPDGELLLLDGDQKISTVNGKGVITKVSRDCRLAETHSSCTEDSSNRGFSEKPNAVTSSADDRRSLLASSSTDQLIVSENTTGCSEELKTERCIRDKNLETPAENPELGNSEKNSGQTEHHVEPSCCEINHAVKEQYDVHRCSKKVDYHKSSEAESTLVHALKTSCDVDEQQKLTRKRPLRNKVADVVDRVPKNHVNAAHGHEVKNGVEEPVSLSTRSNGSSGTVFHSASAFISHIEVNEPKSSSEVDAEQQSLLETLQLVPVSSQLNRPSTVTAPYRTRSSTQACVNVTEAAASKKRRYLDDSKDKSRSSKSASPQGRALSTETATNKMAEINKCESMHRTKISSELVPQKTQTVEPFGHRLARCVKCKTVFQSVPQIIDHVCTGP